MKHGVPSHVSLTAIVEQVELEAFQKAINEWAKSKLLKGKKGTKRIALDSKSIKVSVEEGITKAQNFIAFVEAFCLEQQLVVGALAYENKKQGETQVIQQMINMLGIQGAIFTLDARHDSKKHSNV